MFIETGITGGGKVMIRSDLRQIGASTEGSVREKGLGSLSLPELHDKIQGSRVNHPRRTDAWVRT